MYHYTTCIDTHVNVYAVEYECSVYCCCMRHTLALSLSVIAVCQCFNSRYSPFGFECALAQLHFAMYYGGCYWETALSVYLLQMQIYILDVLCCLG